MSWVFLVDGAAVVVPKGDDDLDDLVLNDPDYQELTVRAEDLGLKLTSSVNDDEEAVAFLIGEEILPSRHVYQGQTHVCPRLKDSIVKSDEFASLVASLEGTVRRHTDLEVKTEWGIVLNQFD